jgi:hypothetical protein
MHGSVLPSALPSPPVALGLHTAKGLQVSDLIIPVRMLATLLLAFVLVAVFQSYQDAGDDAAAEAGAVLAMAEDAVLLTPAARDDVLGRLT